MQVGNLIISEIVKNAYHAEGSLGQNIFLSIAIGISMIAAFEWGRKQSGIKKWGGFVFAGILAFFSLLTESSYNGLAMFIVFYFFYNKNLPYILPMRVCAFSFSCGALIISSTSGSLSING